MGAAQIRSVKTSPYKVVWLERKKKLQETLQSQGKISYMNRAFNKSLKISWIQYTIARNNYFLIAFLVSSQELYSYKKKQPIFFND